MHTFEFGDLVVGNKDARYNITYTGTEWVVTGVDHNRDGEVINLMAQDYFERCRKKGLSEERINDEAFYPVASSKFDFIRNLLREGNKANVHVLERYDRG